MRKISGVEVGQMLKLAADNLRTLSGENQELKEKLAFFEKKERAEKIATAMEDKGIEPEASFEEKVAGLLKRDDLEVVESAVGMSAPQMKLASVHDEGTIEVEGGEHDDDGGAAQANFAAGLASI